MATFDNLTKTRYCLGVQCPKMLWLKHYKPEEFDNTVMNQTILTAGTDVGKLARDTSKIIERYDFKKKENSIGFLYPELLKEWDYERNGHVNPEYVSYGSVRKYWWKCAECGNSFLMAPNNRTHQDQGCPICSRPKRAKTRIAHKLINEGSLAANRPDLLGEWDFEKNTMSPGSYLVGSKSKVWWKCPKCGGSWQAQIYNRTKEKGTGCPYCGRRRALLSRNN